MLSTLVVFVVGALGYLALSFAVSVVVGAMLRGADGSLDAPGARPPRTSAQPTVLALPLGPPVVRPHGAAVGPHGDAARPDGPVPLLSRSLRGRCRRARVVGVGPFVPLVRRLR